MAKIPFSIDYRPQIESEEYKVVTADGRPARIISWDKKVFGGHTEIVALVPTPRGDTETVQLYCPNGTLVASSWNEKFKLFIVTPEQELTKFEKVLNDLIWSIGMGEVVYNNDAIKETAAKLLNIARKQLVEEQYTSDPRKTDLYKLGKAEALKDLPRWRHSLPELGRRYVILFNNGGIVESTDFRENGRFYYEDGESYPDVAYNAVNWMYLEDLLKLPKED